MLLFSLACLPSPLDPVAVTPAGEPPAPIREEERNLPTRDIFIVRGTQKTSLAYGLRGQAPGDVVVDGARVTIAGVPWEKTKVEGVVAAWRLPTAFHPGVVPTNVELNGTPCPIDATLVAGGCAVLSDTLTWAPAKAGQPKTVSFDVAPELAAREAEIRGAHAFVSGLSAVSYLVEGYDKPVFSTHKVGAQLTVQSLPPKAKLTFRPVLLPSPLFVGSGEPVTFDVLVHPKGQEKASTLVSVTTSDDQHEVVEVAVPPEVVPAWTVLTFQTTRSPKGRLGPISAFVDAEIGG